MPATPTTARDEIFRLFTDGWAAQSIVEGDLDLRYQGRELPNIPRGYWGRISTQMVTSQQSAHTMPDGPEASPIEYETNGLVFVQVFAPMAEPDSYRNGDLLAAYCVDIFRRTETASGVWFRNGRFNELEADGQNYRWNVKVEYQFTERKG